MANPRQSQRKMFQFFQVTSTKPTATGVTQNIGELIVTEIVNDIITGSIVKSDQNKTTA